MSGKEAEIVTVKLPSGETYQQPTGLFINNKFVQSRDSKKLASIDPASGAGIASVYIASEQDVNDAVDAAVQAFESEAWQDDVTSSERGRLLYKVAHLIEQEKHFLAKIEALDSGKPETTNALLDIEDVIEVFRYYAGWADKIHGKTIPIDSKHLSYTLHEPLGAVAQIIPWNYPLDMLAWKVAPAIACGNTIVLKSSEVTPLSALYFAKYFVEAGFPPGVINIISGDGAGAGKPLASHPNVSKVAFTGSTNVGKLIQGYAAQNLNPVSMETGGKSPAVILEDADLTKAIPWLAMGIFFNSGQVCSATSRILVQESIYDEFLQRFKDFSAKAYKCGAPSNDSDTGSFDFEGTKTDVTIIGPQVSAKQQQSILSLIETGIKEGAKVVLGGKKPSSSDTSVSSSGYYVEPTILADVTSDSTVFKEEIFGPVVTVSKFSTVQEGVKLANDSKYGLAGAVFTQDLRKAHLVAKKLQSGTIWINASNEAYCQIPFGGVKQSGFGRELGEYSLSLYTQVKSITVNLE